MLKELQTCCWVGIFQCHPTVPPDVSLFW